MKILKVVKTGKSIQKCIEIPDAFLDGNLDICHGEADHAGSELLGEYSMCIRDGFKNS